MLSFPWGSGRIEHSQQQGKNSTAFQVGIDQLWKGSLDDSSFTEEIMRKSYRSVRSSFDTLVKICAAMMNLRIGNTLSSRILVQYVHFHHLSKVRIAGSLPLFRTIQGIRKMFLEIHSSTGLTVLEG